MDRGTMEWVVRLIPILPLLAFLVNGIFGKLFEKADKDAHAHQPKARLLGAYIAGGLVLGSFILSVLVFLNVSLFDSNHNVEGYQFIDSGSFKVAMGFYVDQLTALMLLVVTSVGTLVHLYSSGYMAHDDEHNPVDSGFVRFFTYLPLFVFSMLMLVLANNFLQLYIFWEAVGLCSFLLIGFWYTRKSAGDAAKKAFIVNRVGDFGFSLGIMLLFWTLGNLDYTNVFAKADSIGATTLTVICGLLFLGAMGKSAQFPLHVWLPDAMEGPTPVSALIHAATMVTAGVYLVARAHPLFELAPGVLPAVTIIGVTTALLGATIALVQTDIKKIVAYSTISQLGYMFAGLGVGAIIAALFHLATHAMFKGLLFLGSGSVIHGMENTGVRDPQDIRTMGGIRKFMPITSITFLLAALANAGVVPLAGFFSKDEITGAAFHGGGIIGYATWGLLTLGSFMTAFYMFRLYFIVFEGQPRWRTTLAVANQAADQSTTAERASGQSVGHAADAHGTPPATSGHSGDLAEASVAADAHGGDAHGAHGDPHESPWNMTLPLLVLAVPTVVLGFLLGWPPEAGAIHSFLAGAMNEPIAAEAAAGLTTETISLLVAATVVALAGIGLAYFMYGRRSTLAETLGARFKPVYNLLLNKWYFDDLYQWAIVNNVKRIANGSWWGDANIIDGAVNGISRIVAGMGAGLRKVQTGFVGTYSLAIAFGLLVLVTYVGLLALGFVR